MEQMDSVIGEYFRNLDDGEAAAAAALFAEHASYIRPVMDCDGVPTPELESIKGRDAIEAYFVARGTRPYRHTIRSAVRDGDTEFVEGFVDTSEGPLTTVFLATASLDQHSRIVRYFATATSVTSEGLEALNRTSLPA